MRILIVEDEFLIASAAATALRMAGCEIVAMVGSVMKALQVVDVHALDAVLLDANLHGQSSEPVAAVLKERAIPFLVVSGYGADQCCGTLGEAPFLAKPYKPATLVSSVLALKGATWRAT